jgi:hypothetical protein
MKHPVAVEKGRVVLYPECEKLSAARPKSQVIGEFLEWLASEKEIHLDQSVRLEDLLAEFFGIDQNKLEKERRMMLDNLREGHAEREKKAHA